jgi:hypothetical protein
MPSDTRAGATPPARMVADSPCAACGKQSAHVELVAPTSCPLDGRTGTADSVSHTTGTMSRIAGDSSTTARPRAVATGTDIDVLEAVRITAAFTPPVHAARVHDAVGFYDSAGLCDLCDVPYCREHLHVTASGTGTCRQGHTKSLDPHWSPDDW